MLKKNLLLIFLILIFQQSLSAEIIKVFDFTEIEFETLKVKKVRGADNKTKYSLGKNENGNFLRSEAENAASGLGKEIKINLSKTPFLNITWKVEKDLSGIIENSKKGHDYAARVFVIKKTGATPLSNRAMNYVYSSNNEINTNQLVWTPTATEPLLQTLMVTITDKYGHSSKNQFDINLLMSPCEQTDSLNCTEIDTIYIETPESKETDQKKHWRPKTFSPFTN